MKPIIVISWYCPIRLLEASLRRNHPLAPDAEFEVLAPAFDTTQNWSDPGDGTTVLVYASTGGSNQGQLVLSTDGNASGVPVARLIQIESPTSLIIAGLNGRVA